VASPLTPPLPSLSLCVCVCLMAVLCVSVLCLYLMALSLSLIALCVYVCSVTPRQFRKLLDIGTWHDAAPGYEDS
jgi:hypothetical protein